MGLFNRNAEPAQTSAPAPSTGGPAISLEKVQQQAPALVSSPTTGHRVRPPVWELASFLLYGSESMWRVEPTDMGVAS